MKTMETTDKVFSDGMEKLVERRNWRQIAPCAREKNEAQTENRTCKSAEQEENDEKAPRRARARNQMGNHG